MLFLFNDVVFDVGDPRETAMRCGAPFSAGQLMSVNVAQAAKMVREAVFADPAIAQSHDEKPRFLAALIAWKTKQANAMLAVRPTASKSALDVNIRLAAASTPVMQRLLALQENGRLTLRAAEDAIWAVAPARLRA
ncbi:hypothetical protein DDZ18_09935 [Marinicauda salina]|jgi:hypothetical protein|uniref:Uncharacterized protein n=1 Tax=Marinicauda salina TaxID=2135793 RepID=A0A2U2BSL7_9PROT|nr:hypothetical protein [Marinicauda salina]PWE17015.1 hypothetical protein DDZ18_09935 [Marinicauda salina]